MEERKAAGAGTATVHCVSAASLGNGRVELRTDLAAEKPIYVYRGRNGRFVLHSCSAVALLADERVEKPLAIHSESVSFLLQSGVVPPPATVYADVFLLGLGDSLELSAVEGAIRLAFHHRFSFFNALRSREAPAGHPGQHLLQLLAEATAARIDGERPTFLFHSAGKDSNAIALALAEAGWQDRVTLLSHRSKGQADESAMSAAIARKLGFRHVTLGETDVLAGDERDAVDACWEAAPFPCLDTVMLAYPLYARQRPEIVGANLIDGGGNDAYFSLPPSWRETISTGLARGAARLAPLRERTDSLGVPARLLRTPAEWLGLGGFSLQDARRLLPEAVSTFPHWRDESARRSAWDPFDFKSDVVGSIVAGEVHLRKIRTFADITGSRLVLPFAAEPVARYVASLPEACVFDRRRRRNKILLRNLLGERLGLDSDAIGKMGFTYDYQAVVMENLSWIEAGIANCGYWQEPGAARLVAGLRQAAGGRGRRGAVARALLYRLFLLSKWISLCRYLR